MSARSATFSRGGVIAKDYSQFVPELLRRARFHVELNVFYADVRVHRDPDRKVLALVHGLAAAASRGVPTRVLIGGNTTTPDLTVANLSTARYLREIGVSVRAFRSGDRDLTHSKALVVDDACLVGSHNWEHDALTEYRETSVWIQSVDLSSELVADFDRQWAISPETAS